MPTRGLSVLSAITVTMFVACWFAVDDRYSNFIQNTQEGGLVFPELQYQLAEITDIEVTRPGGKFVLSHRENAWVNFGIGGFPSVSDRVESIIAGMASMRYIAPKTGRGKLYHRLQVEDVTPTAKSTRLTFRDRAGATLADVIIGKPKDAHNQKSVYVRFPDDAQAWLVTGVFDVYRDAVEWSNRLVVDFDAHTLNALTVSRLGRETVALYRNQPHDRKMTLKNLPSNASVAHQHQIDYMAGLLQDLNFIDAKHASEKILKVISVFKIVARWKNYLAVTLHAGEPMEDGSVWVQIDARVTDNLRASDIEKQEADRIRSKFSGWCIKLSRKFTDRIEIRLNDIIKPGATS